MASMELEGGCHCRAVRFKPGSALRFKGQCHGRECQYISGGSPVVGFTAEAQSFHRIPEGIATCERGSG